MAPKRVTVLLWWHLLLKQQSTNLTNTEGLKSREKFEKPNSMSDKKTSNVLQLNFGNATSSDILNSLDDVWHHT
ncbi:hypothetical protein TYRP_018634 [Tyrophagus putrescentiae]|nr:hypothetical protein TYRP_018634 [Tyrophagus putrescentiae]